MTRYKPARCFCECYWSDQMLWISLWKQHNFPKCPRLQDFFMCAASFCQWQLFANDGSQGTVLQAGLEPGVNLGFFGFADAPQGKGMDGAPASHQVTR